KMKDVPRGFKVPFMPYIPALGVLVCLGMMAFLPFDTWIRLLVWLLIGLDIYEQFGIKRSKANVGEKHYKDRAILSICGAGLTLVLIILAFLHYYATDESGFGLFIFSVIFGGLHLIYYIYRYSQDRKGAIRSDEMKK